MTLKLLGVLLICCIAAEEYSSLIEFGEENLQPYKRSAKNTRSADTYDTTTVIKVNEPVDSSIGGHKRCWNSGVFAVVSAVEIAYTLATGIVRKFSEQELIDCFYRGCHPTSSTAIIRWLMVNDRLAQSDNYTPYLAEHDICRAAFAPDGLDKVEVTDVFSVSVDDVEEAIREYGSVTACMYLSTKNCPMYETYKKGDIIRGPSVNSCNHVVNIVGYTKTSYKIKDHRGSTWGDAGYFYVARGGNACGVEHKMIALSARKREGMKPLARNGCPLSAPVYCDELKTCTARYEPCVKPKSAKAKRSADTCTDVPGYNCKSFLRLCDRVPRFAKNCRKSCNKCVKKDVYTGHCKDDPKADCVKLERVCKRSQLAKYKCPRTCRVPDGECKIDRSRHPQDNRPMAIKGQCYVPDIPNGKVTWHSNGMLESGSELRIECFRGYVKVGRPSHCGVQKVYGPDSRLMQSCMRENSEAYTSEGYDYNGMMTRPVRGVSLVPCDNWNELIVRGKFHNFITDVATAKALMFGNHQFCRNSKEIKQPVPFCIVESNKIAYCKTYPACDFCEDGVKDEDAYCEFAQRGCPYSTEYRLNANKDAWTYCKRSCCSLAGCV